MRRLALRVLLVAAVAALASIVIAFTTGARTVGGFGLAMTWGGLLTIAIGALAVFGNTEQRDFTIQYAATTSDTPGAERGRRIVRDALVAYAFALTCFLAGALVLGLGIVLHRSVP